jgi:hypothetical protein
MSGGAGIVDLLPLPADTSPLTEKKEEVAQTLEEKPTESHALALEEQEEKGQYHLQYS